MLTLRYLFCVSHKKQYTLRKQYGKKKSAHLPHASVVHKSAKGAYANAPKYLILNFWPRAFYVPDQYFSGEEKRKIYITIYGDAKSLGKETKYRVF